MNQAHIKFYFKYLLFSNIEIGIMDSTLHRPPQGFAFVEEGVFRSSYPTAKAWPFLDKLGLKTVICLSPGDVREDLRIQLKTRNISMIGCDVGVNQVITLCLKTTKPFNFCFPNRSRFWSCLQKILLLRFVMP